MIGFKTFLQTIFKNNTVFLSFLLILILPENVSAGILNLNCNVQSHFKVIDDVSWFDDSYDWEVEIDQRKRIMLIKQSVFYKGKTHNIKFDYSIINQDMNKIIAISDQRTSIEGGSYITALTFDLNSKQISGANIISDYRGVAFANYNGKCFYN